MTATEALYMLERIDRHWSVTDQQLADAECILSDKLEAVQGVRRDRRQTRDMVESACPDCLPPIWRPVLFAV